MATGKKTDMPSKQVVARLISGEISYRITCLKEDVSEDAVQAEYAKFCKRKDIAALMRRLAKAEKEVETTCAQLAKITGSTADSLDSFEYRITSRIKSDMQRIRTQHDGDVGKLRQLERQLQSRLQLAQTSEQISDIMKEAGLLERAVTK